MKLRPLQDRVLIRRVEPEAKTAGGIFIPDTAQEKPMEGEVVAVGPGARDADGKLHPLDVALVQTARPDRLRWYAERAEVGNGQTEDCRRAVQGSPLRPRRRHPVRALVSSL
jgi:Chaperonin 10 Kd subunit